MFTITVVIKTEHFNDAQTWIELFERLKLIDAANSYDFTITQTKE